MRYQLKNFTDRDYETVDVKLHGHGEEQITPESIQFRGLKGFARRHKDVELRVTPPLDAVSIDSLITFNGSHTFEHLYFILASGYRAPGFSLEASKPPGPVVHVPGPMHPVHVADQSLKHHSFDFAVGYDDDSLVIWADVEEDLLFAIKERRPGPLEVDLFRIFLDGRQSREIGLDGYTDNVMHISICPPPRDETEPYIRPSKEVEINAVVTHTALGYRLGCRVPWSCFCQDEGKPDLIGFDLALVSHDGEGKQVLRLSWTGREDQESNTASFGKLLLV